MDTINDSAGGTSVQDDTHAKEMMDAYHLKVVELDRMQIQGQLQHLDEQISASDVPIFAFGLISDLKDAVLHWTQKKEMLFEGKTYRNYSTALVSLEGESNLIFSEIQLIFDKPEDSLPIGGSITETKPDENGSLHEHHFSVKYYSESVAEIQYLEFPYRQKEVSKPIINTKAIVVVARRMIQQLPR